MRSALIALAAILLAVPASAAANGSLLPQVPVAATDLVDATGAVAPSAAAGHVVFSRQVPATGRFELVEWSAAHGLRVLPVGDRAVPFDADAGRGASGAVVTYSRCTVEGTLSYVLPSVDFSAARGCRPYILDLDRPGARPRELRLTRAAGLSLTTPSVHGRSVAAVATPDGGGNARILLWRRTSQSPVRLRGGTAPKCPFRTCSTPPRSSVDVLDLGPRSVAFLWRLSQPPYGVGPGVELRTSSLRPGGAGHQIPSAQGYLSGACGFRQPLSPTAGSGGGVAFLLVQSPCEGIQTTLAVQRAGSPLVLGARPAGSLAFGAAFDADRVFWLRGAAPLRTEDLERGAGAQPAIPCARPGAACRLVVSRTLPLKVASGRRH
jgi:hypothetical protein